MTEWVTPQDWFWEGNVQARIVEHLERQRWNVVHVADTGRRERGPDIDARKLHRPLLVEVKGFPSDRYRDPRRASERKPTSPRLQARHWFAEAFLKVVTLADQADAWETAIGLPDLDPYEDLVRECERSLQALGIGVYFVHRDGTVVERLGHRARAETFAALGLAASGE